MTTILSVRKGNKVCIAGDGQISLGHTIMKDTAKKVRSLANDKVIAGFAGATADALTLMERLETKLEKSTDLLRASVELAKDWRTDKYLRKLEAMMIVANDKHTLIISGNGDVIEPKDGVAAIGSGGNYALAAAKALIEANPELSVEQITRKAMKIAADICVYTNDQIHLITIPITD